MAQTVFFSYKDDDSSFAFNARLVGILSPGCYRGFDWFDNQPDWQLRLGHTLTGVTHIGQDGNEEASPRGVVFTRQGTVIMEDAAVALPIAPADPTQHRTDLIVCDHRHTLAPGGTPAFYAVVRGVPGGGTPTLPRPGRQTIIGTLIIPPGIPNLSASGIRWELNRPELSGRTAYSLPYTVAHWTKAHNWALPQKFAGVGLEYRAGNGITYDGSTGALAITSNTGSVFHVDQGGDYVSLSVPNVRRGEVFQLRFTQAGTLKKGAPGSTGTLQLPGEDIAVRPGDSALFMVLNDNSVVLLHMLLGDPARLNQTNRFTRTNSESFGTITLLDYGPSGQVRIRGAEFPLMNGNHFRLNMPTPAATPNFLTFLSAAPEGTEITLIIPQAGRPVTGPAHAPVYSEAQQPEWALFDHTAVPTMPTPAGMMPIKLFVPAQGYSRYLSATTAAGAAFKFLSHAGAWLLVGNSEFTMHAPLHDRQKIYNNRANRPFPFPDSSDELVRYGPAPGPNRDYMVHLSIWFSRISTVPELSVTFSRQAIWNGQGVPYVGDEATYGFIVNGGDGASLSGTWTHLFTNVRPGEAMIARITRRGGGSNQINVQDYLLIVDGTIAQSV